MLVLTLLLVILLSVPVVQSLMVYDCDKAGTSFQMVSFEPGSCPTPSETTHHQGNGTTKFYKHNRDVLPYANASYPDQPL